MYISKVVIRGFRGLRDVSIPFHEGLNVLIGENNTGKTAVMDILRHALSLGGQRSEPYVVIDDFHLMSDGKRVDRVEADVHFAGQGESELAPLYEMLAVVDNGSPELQLHLRFDYDTASDRIHRRYWGGCNEDQRVPSEVLELLYATHLGALRDASTDLTPRRGNRLSRLFLKLVPDESARNRLADRMNASIGNAEGWHDLLATVDGKVNEHLASVALAGELRKIGVKFSELDFRRIAEGVNIRTPLRPELPPQAEVWQNGMGYANLIYMATVLGDLVERRQGSVGGYVALMIEEPEAHLHPQWQDLLFSYLQAIALKSIQVFLTSHSPTITAKADLDSLVVLSQENGNPRACAVRGLPLEKQHKNHLHRFLDVTRCQLFFAKGVILVEGISEALLLPALARRLGAGYDLEKCGVEIVNINGVAFEPFARLFNADNPQERLAVRCALVTDDDRHTTGDGKSMSARAQKASTLECGYLRTFLAQYTLEFELYVGNSLVMEEVYRDLHVGAEVPSKGTVEEGALAFIHRLGRGKAEFAQVLAERIGESPSLVFNVPVYLAKAIRWVTHGEENAD
jgi:putative ATP-dependent endonuclease of OLD family